MIKVSIACMAVVSCVFVFALWSQIKPFESNELAFVSWQSSGKPLEARIFVTDVTGNPVSGVNVHIDNNSGGNGTQTNNNGIAVVNLGETDMSGIKVNGKTIVDRPYAYLMNSPHVKDGLEIEIVIRNDQILADVDNN